MDNLALSVSKSITDFLEQNEKRFVNQNSVQDQHSELLSELKIKIEQLEERCDGLEAENKSLKTEVETVKQREDSITKDLILTKSDLERIQKDMKDCRDWMDLMVALTQQVQELRDARDLTKGEIAGLSNNQSELVKRVDSIAQTQSKLAARVKEITQLHSDLVKQLNIQRRLIEKTAEAAASAQAPTPNPNAPHYNIINRTPIRSPSTSSFFNSNIGSHNSMHRYRTNTSNNNHHHFINEDFMVPSDAYDEVCDLSDSAADLVKELNDIHRSFEKGSICSD